MCGIYFRYKGLCSTIPTRHEILKNRGPDNIKEIYEKNYCAIFYRLAIIGLDNGMQPFIDKTDKTDILLMCNGEIYNNKNLETKYNLSISSSSDCECIMDLYKKLGIERTVRLLDGEFAFVLYDIKKDLIYCARDRLGRKPLFFGCTMNTKNNEKIDNIEIASLYGALEFETKLQVQPGRLLTYDIKNKSISIQEYHRFMFNPLYDTLSNDILTQKPTNDELYNSFVTAVQKRVIHSERSIGFLLSGGFDSSAVLSVALKHKMLNKAPNVFTIGFDENAPDIKSAELMVNYLRTMYGSDCIIWHKIIMPIESGIKAIPDVISALETYDTTTIRASTPMYLISKFISENTDVKVILSGEGSDELFGGYLYFRYAPNDQAFRSEICNLLSQLYLYDVLRADRTTAHFGLEVRPPFLDDEFVALVLSSDRLVKSNTTTKSLIREVMTGRDILPDPILFGKKEAFSDAVGLSWKDSISEYAEKNIVSNLFKTSSHILPETAEAAWFQSIFSSKFPDSWHLLPALWLPNQTWVKTGSEPSARVLGVYNG